MNMTAKFWLVIKVDHLTFFIFYFIKKIWIQNELIKATYLLLKNYGDNIPNTIWTSNHIGGEEDLETKISSEPQQTRWLVPNNGQLHTPTKRFHTGRQTQHHHFKNKVWQLRHDQRLTIYNINKIYIVRLYKYGEKGLRPIIARKHKQISNRSKCLKNLDVPLNPHFLTLSRIQPEWEIRWSQNHPTNPSNLIQHHSMRHQS